jgi:hypothetical protein
MDLYLFALLPLALFSLFEKGRHRHTAGFGFLAALAPVIAKGIGSLISHKQNKAKEKQAQEQAKLDAAAADTRAKQQWETDQNSPAAQAGRFKNTMQLGRLAGAMGGSLDKVPPSMLKYYQSQRTMPEYTGTSSYVPQAKKGGGGWDFAAGVADAASYLDTSKLGAPKASAGLMAAGNAAAHQRATPMGGGMATSLLDPLIKKVSTGTR